MKKRIAHGIMGAVWVGLFFGWVGMLLLMGWMLYEGIGWYAVTPFIVAGVIIWASMNE